MAICHNIMYAVSHLEKYSENPSQAHWTATQHVIHYLNRTCDQRLILGSKQPIVLCRHVNSAFAQDLNNWKSTSGYAFNLGSCVHSGHLHKIYTPCTTCTKVHDACNMAAVPTLAAHKQS